MLTADNQQSKDRTVRLAYLLIDGFALMSYAPVIEPFRAANRLSGKNLYSWQHYSVSGEPALASNGVSLKIDDAIEAMQHADILFVCAGGNPAEFSDRKTLGVLRRAARHGTALAGVSGGPFIVAQAGLLDGHRCTIHWEYEHAFQETFSLPKLERSLFVIDKDRLTCAGGLAGLDLTIHLISDRHGRKLASKVSDWYIQTEQRQGIGAQRRSPAQRYGIAHPSLESVLSMMESNLSEPCTREALAKAANLSIRQLERLFAEKIGLTINRQYLLLRLDAARKLISNTTMSLREISVACGFSSFSHFSRTFKHSFDVTPSSMRNGSTVE